jgi:hypothetical protein
LALAIQIDRTKCNAVRKEKKKAWEKGEEGREGGRRACFFAIEVVLARASCSSPSPSSPLAVAAHSLLHLGVRQRSSSGL